GGGRTVAPPPDRSGRAAPPHALTVVLPARAANRIPAAIGSFNLAAPRGHGGPEPPPPPPPRPARTARTTPTTRTETFHETAVVAPLVVVRDRPRARAGPRARGRVRRRRPGDGLGAGALQEQACPGRLGDVPPC